MAMKLTVDHDIINKDRISELPRNLIDSILERISTRDAARTTILSKRWRYIWSSLPKLVLDKQFFLGITPNNGNNSSQFSKIIDRILMVHNGPIQEFIHYIPFSQSPNMDIWILILSRNGIKELTVDNAYLHPYKLPSYIFSCDQLTYLNVCNCVLNPPLAFSGFYNLNKLFLKKIPFSTNIGSLLSTLPALHELSLRSCTGVENLKFLSPKLIWFVLVNSHEFQWQCFQSVTNLEVLYIALCKEIENVDAQVKHFKLMTLLADFPRLYRLWLDGFSLKFLAAGIFTKCHLNYKLVDIKLLSVRFNDLDQVSCALCLLRSSPNLQKLEIEASIVTHGDMKQQDLDDMEATANSDMALNHLQNVKLRFFNGFKAELLFVKLLLSCSPRLQRIIIERRLSHEMSADEEFRISRQLMRFRRASTVSEILYEKPN